MTTYAIVGSRNFNDYTLLKLTLDKYKMDKIVSGGANGTDILAIKYAREMKIPYQEFLPDYIRFGKTAPLIRNTKIVDAADIIIAFWDGKSAGTFHTINYAKRRGKKVEVIK